MEHLGLKVYIVCILSMVDLDQFIGNAKFAKFAFCAVSRPNYLYQVGFLQDRRSSGFHLKCADCIG